MSGKRRPKPDVEQIVRVLDKLGRQIHAIKRDEDGRSLARYLASRPARLDKAGMQKWAVFEELVSVILDEGIPKQLIQAAYRRVLDYAEHDVYESYADVLKGLCGELKRELDSVLQPDSLEELPDRVANDSVEDAVANAYYGKWLQVALSKLNDEEIRVIDAWLDADGNANAAARHLGWTDSAFDFAMSGILHRLRASSPGMRDML